MASAEIACTSYARKKAVAVILGSAFNDALVDSGSKVQLGTWSLTPVRIGDIDSIQLIDKHVQEWMQRVASPVYAVKWHDGPRQDGGGAYVMFRHGIPHDTYPHEIAYMVNMAILYHLGVGSVLVTSSVGVLDRKIPTDVPILIEDILLMENLMPAVPSRPDGHCFDKDARFMPHGSSVCSVWCDRQLDLGLPPPGHLLVGEEGLLSDALSSWLDDTCGSSHAQSSTTSPEPASPDALSSPGLASGVPATLRPADPESRPVVFAYCRGPRSKTPAENRAWRALGASVNSMTLGPEVVMAAELGMCAAAVVVGHKRSEGRPGMDKEDEPPGKALAGGSGIGSGSSSIADLEHASALHAGAPPPTTGEILGQLDRSKQALFAVVDAFLGGAPIEGVSPPCSVFRFPEKERVDGSSAGRKAREPVRGAGAARGSVV